MSCQRRAILHVDMDAFFAAIEQLDHPELRGRPVLVGSDQRRGVVATASYEARAFGCHSAQPMAVALRRCPHAAVMPVRGGRYRDVSRQVFDLLGAFAPCIEPLSIDEAFLDVSGTGRLFGPPAAVARRIKQTVRETVGLSASVGVAPNKFLAKLASDMDKPDGLTIIEPEEVQRVLDPLPITRIWGLGPATASRLEAMGVRTVADLRRIDRDRLERRFGREGERFHRLARGLDERPVTPDHRARSIGQEQTFVYDVADRDHLHAVLMGHVEQVGHRLRRHGLAAGVITVKIRYGDFETITRSTALPTPTNATQELWRAARDLFDRWAGAAFAPVRLLGATASRLTRGGEQLGLFEIGQRQRQSRIDAVNDRIRDRFGRGAIGRAAGLRPGRHR